MTEDQIRRMTSPSKQLDDVLREQQELLSVTLSSIGDAVIATDNNGCVTFLNPVAQTLTGWTQTEAAGKSLATVFRIINEASRQSAVNPASRALEEGVIVGLSNHTLLIAKDGKEWPIEDGAAPIRNAEGKVAGVVLVFRDVTERRRKEKLAGDALAYADNILATLREPFLVLDQDLRVVTANCSFYETFGVAAEETQGRFIYELGNRQWEIPKLRTLLEEVLPRNHAFQGFEVEHDFTTIGRKIMLLNARRIRKPGNDSELILLAIEDVTERRFGDAASGTLASIVESSDAAIISKTLGSIITSWNGSAERLFGYTKAEAVGKNISLIIPVERQAEADEVIAHVRRGERVEHFETQRITKDGRRLSISMTVSPIRSATGQIIGASKIARDVSERQRTQSRLEVSETRFRRLFEAAHDGILILDAASQKITHVNPFLTDLLDYPPEHFVGKELWEIGFLCDKEASQSAMLHLNTLGEIRYESLPLEDSQGRLHPVEMVANVYDEGHHRVIQCNIRDISVRSGLEKLLRGQASELSDLHRRKDEFLAMLSHELRSPLAPIANALQLLGLQRASENRIQQQARSIIERQLAQLQHLVDDLLEVSRITTGRVQLRREPVDVSDIVAGAVETVRPLIEQRRHELTVSLSPETIWLHADAARLEQVLVNLLTNAAKYTEEGGHIWLTTELASGRDAPDECVLRVRDTGVGIAASLLPHIFDLFTQAERSLDRSQGGLGIGLALVHRLTELHGGTVEANSTLGEGSEFIVHLPVMPIGTPQPESPAAEPGVPATRPLRVLVVDDNMDTVLTFSILLKASGHDVRTANDGPTGVEAALAYLPDVALLDIGLPGLNGYEVAKRIRHEPTLQNAVLVALTGYGQETDREISRQAGFNHHLVKPANFDKLQQILATVAEQLI